MLRELSLDDTTYAALVEAGQRRLPGLSRGQWTDHNAHDPGLTLLELYAYLLEQRVYWLDQVSPELERALLRLQGVRPLRARAARTVLVASSSRRRHLALKAGTVVEAHSESVPLRFTLEESLTVVSCRRVEVVAAECSRTLDLQQGRSFPLLPTRGGRAELALELELDSPWGARAARLPVALLLELLTPESLRPEWDPDSVEAPPPVQLEVHVSTLQGLLPVRFQDGTGGLRRSGLLRLEVPESWSPADSGLYRIVLSTPRATFSCPPRLVRLELNAVQASHSVERTHVVRASEAHEWPKLPGRQLELVDANGPPLPSRVELELYEGEPPRWQRWEEVEDLTALGPAERAFTVEGALVRFGDGRTGRQPVLASSGEERLRVRYQAGGGEAGNVGANTRFHHPWRRSLQLHSAVPAVGGRGDEPQAAARARAAALQQATTRAVTEEDYATLARATPGVAIRRAIALVGRHPRHALPVPGFVTLYVVPDVPRSGEPGCVEPWEVPAPVADPGALQAVRRHLESARLLGTQLCVCSAPYRQVRLALRVRLGALEAGWLRERLTQALRTYLDPLVGGDEGRGWPWGAALEPSALTRLAQQSVGEEATVSGVAVGLDGEPPRPVCGPVPLGSCALPHLTEVTFQLEPRRATGGLQ